MTSGRHWQCIDGVHYCDLYFISCLELLVMENQNNVLVLFLLYIDYVIDSVLYVCNI